MILFLTFISKTKRLLQEWGINAKVQHQEKNYAILVRRVYRPAGFKYKQTIIYNNKDILYRMSLKISSVIVVDSVVKSNNINYSFKY